MTYVIGLTGGIGSGKTVASDHFATLGVPIIDTDVIARTIVEPEQPALLALVESFGGGILQSDGTLDRGELRKLAFANEENKEKLDSITHPAIRIEMLKQVSSQTVSPYCVVVVPLLAPNSVFSETIQRILVVTTELETKIKRVMKRSNLNRDEVLRIMATQLSDEERLSFADDVIANDGSIEDAHIKVEKLHELYLTLSGNN